MPAHGQHDTGSEILLYQAEDQQTRIQVRLMGDGAPAGVRRQGLRARRDSASWPQRTRTTSRPSRLSRSGCRPSRRGAGGEFESDTSQPFQLEAVAAEIDARRPVCTDEAPHELGSDRYQVVLTTPPLGKKSSIMGVTEEVSSLTRATPTASA
jgi:hypothetical protein